MAEPATLPIGARSGRRTGRHASAKWLIISQISGLAGISREFASARPVDAVSP
jgi:hypothetical protein